MQRVQAAPASEKQSGASRLTGLVGLAVAAPGVAVAAGEKPVHLPPVTVKENTESVKTGKSASIKNTEALVDTPRSIAVIPQEVIRATAASELSEVLRTVPGITFSAGEGGNPLGDQPFIRGYDAQSSTFVDGMRDIGSQSRELFNVESVEVSKGPAGTFDGRGSVGGSIRLASKAPKLGNFAEGSLALGNANLKRATADGNWQLSDTIAARLNVMGHDADVPGRDKVHDRRWGVAPSVAFGLGTPTRATLSYFHIQSDNQPDAGIPYSTPTDSDKRKNPPPRVLQPGDGSPVKVPRNTYYGLTDRDFRQEQVDTGTLTLEHDFSEALKVRNRTRFTHHHQDYIVTHPDSIRSGNIYYGMVFRRPATRDSHTHVFTNQTDAYGQFATGAVKHNYAMGVEFSRERGSNDTYSVGTADQSLCPKGAGKPSGYNCTTLSGANPDDPWKGTVKRNNTPARTTINTAALYLLDSAHIGDRWILSGGVRLDRYTVDTAPSNTGLRVRREDTLVNYHAGVVYKPARNGSVYLSYGTSSKPAGSLLGQGREDHAVYNSRSVNHKITNNLAPEKSASVELGTKWDVLDDKLALTAAIFRIDTNNARMTLEDNSYAMVGKKRVQGFELGAAGNITPQWSVFGGYSYLKSELVRAGGSGKSHGLQDGNAFPNTPKNAFSLWTDYKVTPKFKLGGGAYYVSKVWGNQSENRWVPAYWRFDAMASYRFNKFVSAQVNVNNLANKAYYAKAQPGHYGNMAPGRLVMGTLNVRY